MLAFHRSPHRRHHTVAATACLAAFGLVLTAAPYPGDRATAASPTDLVSVVTSTVRTVAGKVFTATNHLVDTPGAVPAGTAGHQRKEYLVVWAGDQNVTDTEGADLQNLPLSLAPALQHPGDLLPGQDFFAVIDADRESATYGKVVNTVTLGPVPENEPHHMQYIWHKGDQIFAGGLFSSFTYVLDTAKLPLLTLSGVTLPTDTLCGSIPDAYWVLKDGTAYGTYMGGPVLPGPCVYSDGQVRIGNGYGGTPGEVVRLDETGTVLSQVPAAQAVSEDPVKCVSIPTLGLPSCANPHGIQVREDLDRMITSDYAEPRDIILDPVKPPSPYVGRNTVRIWDIAERNTPKLVSVGTLPDGPRVELNPAHEEPQAVMETTVTNLPRHRGAFAETMCGGAIYYTPDLTAANPRWREVFDDSTAARRLVPGGTELAGCDGGGWVQTSLDDKYLYHAVIGRNHGTDGPGDPGSPRMVYALDIQKLLAAGSAPGCSIDTADEIYDGGNEADCPTVASVLAVHDPTTGGPHWGTLDNFARGGDGSFHETTTVTRISYADYFVARTGLDGDHRICMVDVGAGGKLTLDAAFRDEQTGTPCVDFDRTVWPHGSVGGAKPHSQLFIVADADLR
jgi:hypothetical protein